MKIEEYDCIKIKRLAQERIHAETQGMNADQLVAYFHQIGEDARKRRTELHAREKNGSV
jgi:hypothetical protein